MIKSFKKKILGFQFCQVNDASKFLKEVKQMSEKLKIKQTVADKKKLQNFLETEVKQGKMRQKIYRTANYDQDFNKFLQDYKSKHKEFTNIIDISSYSQDQGLFTKTSDMRKDELLWLDEFRKRQQESLHRKMKQDVSQDQQEDHIEEEDKNDKDDASNDDIKTIPDSDAKQFGKQLFENESFVMLVLSRGSTTQVTTLQRIMRMRYLIFMGNCNGVVGYGKGKGLDYEDAMNKAVQDCKKNLIALNLDHMISWPREIKETYQGVILKVTPNKSFNSFGHPAVAMMLMLAGITHCKFQIVHRNLNMYALVMVYFKVVTQTLTPKQISEMFGMKIYRRNWGKPVYLNNIPKDII